MAKPREIVNAVTPDQMRTLRVGPGWDDGREGYSWCRFDAVIDPARRLRAEITWDDDCDFDDNHGLPPRVYFAPILRLETNRPESPSGATGWVTWDEISISLTRDGAITLIASEPAVILNRYRQQIEALKVWARSDGYPDKSSSWESVPGERRSKPIPAKQRTKPTRRHSLMTVTTRHVVIQPSLFRHISPDFSLYRDGAYSAHVEFTDNSWNYEVFHDGAMTSVASGGPINATRDAACGLALGAIARHRANQSRGASQGSDVKTAKLGQRIAADFDAVDREHAALNAQFEAVRDAMDEARDNLLRCAIRLRVAANRLREYVTTIGPVDLGGTRFLLENGEVIQQLLDDEPPANEGGAR